MLLRVKEGDRNRFRCHTGHAYSVASLLASVGEGIEDSLWNAIRALEEGDRLMRDMADHLKTSHQSDGADVLLDRAEEAKRQSDVIRGMVSGREPLATEKA